jgi:hypothetical protein
MLVVLWLSFVLITHGRWGGYSDYRTSSDLDGKLMLEYAESWNWTQHVVISHNITSLKLESCGAPKTKGQPKRKSFCSDQRKL